MQALPLFAGKNNVQGACDMGFYPICSPAIKSVTDEGIRQKFAQAWHIPVEKLDPQVGYRITEVPHLAIEGKVKAYYIMEKIHFKLRQI